MPSRGALANVDEQPVSQHPNEQQPIQALGLSRVGVVPTHGCAHCVGRPFNGQPWSIVGHAARARPAKTSENLPGIAFATRGGVARRQSSLNPEKTPMHPFRWASLAAISLGVILVGLVPAPADEPAKKIGPEAKEWDRVVNKAIDFLKSSQGAEGGWSVDRSPGVTGVALTGMLQTGKITAKDPTVEKALKCIESLVNPKAGHIAGRDPKVQLQNYVTCVNVMALVAADRESYKKVIGDAAKFLKKLQSR